MLFDGFIYASLAKINSHVTRTALDKTAFSLVIWQYTLQEIGKSTLSSVWALDFIITFLGLSHFKNWPEFKSYR